MKEIFNNNTVTITGLCDFDINQIFDCGQCFRFDPSPDGGIEGVAFGRFIRFKQPDEGTLIITGSDKADYESIWKPYLTLDDDYGAIKADIAARFAPFDKTGIIDAAILRGGGIRILRQDPWETLCSFIISQNNNIPRIKKIIAALSDTYGERIAGERIADDKIADERISGENIAGKKFERTALGGARRIYSAFPTARALCDAGTDAIYALRTGFRAKYIYDAARRVADGSTDLDAISKMPSAEAAAELMKIKGVGIKVANCTLLFGFGRTDAFPVDVWIKRVLEKYYPDGIDITALGPWGGIAQQYLFYYERYTSE